MCKSERKRETKYLSLEIGVVAMGAGTACTTKHRVLAPER
jgi:uncharacterized membrane-anchored protein